MPNLPYRDGSSQWIDLIAFVAVLVLAAVLLIFGHVTAASLATICAALGGLYAGWRHLHAPKGSRGKNDTESESERPQP